MAAIAHFNCQIFLCYIFHYCQPIKHLKKFSSPSRNTRGSCKQFKISVNCEKTQKVPKPHMQHLWPYRDKGKGYCCRFVQSPWLISIGCKPASYSEELALHGDQPRTDGQHSRLCDAVWTVNICGDPCAPEPSRASKTQRDPRPTKAAPDAHGISHCWETRRKCLRHLWSD